MVLLLLQKVFGGVHISFAGTDPKKPKYEIALPFLSDLEFEEHFRVSIILVPYFYW